MAKDLRPKFFLKMGRGRVLSAVSLQLSAVSFQRSAFELVLCFRNFMTRKFFAFCGEFLACETAEIKRMLTVFVWKLTADG